MSLLLLFFSKFIIPLLCMDCIIEVYLYIYSLNLQCHFTFFFSKFIIPLLSMDYYIVVYVYIFIYVCTYTYTQKSSMFFYYFFPLNSPSLCLAWNLSSLVYIYTKETQFEFKHPYFMNELLLLLMYVHIMLRMISTMFFVNSFVKSQ